MAIRLGRIASNDTGFYCGSYNSIQLSADYMNGLLFHVARHELIVVSIALAEKMFIRSIMVDVPADIQQRQGNNNT